MWALALAVVVDFPLFDCHGPPFKFCHHSLGPKFLSRMAFISSGVIRSSSAGGTPVTPARSSLFVRSFVSLTLSLIVCLFIGLRVPLLVPLLWCNTGVCKDL